MTTNTAKVRGLTNESFYLAKDVIDFRPEVCVLYIKQNLTEKRKKNGYNMFIY